MFALYSTNKNVPITAYKLLYYYEYVKRLLKGGKYLKQVKNIHLSY